MIQQDKLETEKQNVKNSLEEYVYEMRDKIETSLQQYISDEVCRPYYCIVIDAM